VAGLIVDFNGAAAGAGSTARLLDSVSVFAEAGFTFGSGASGFDAAEGTVSAAGGAGFSLKVAE
jgi:hypothetical protein